MNTPNFEAPDLGQLAERLPAYEFESLIAVGGMGAVYKARQRSLDRDVAIKILPRELGEDPEFRESFIHEARAMARLNHPNLIGVYDSGDVDGMPFMVMEYVHGKSLFHSAYQSQIEPRQAAEIIRGVCEGLYHAHENGIIHRDIKPANILLTPKAEPKIGDFGLARPPGPDSPGLIMGTPGYAAPEVVEVPEHADHRSDLFAVGVLLYELITGALPGPDGLPPSILCGCDPELDAICLKAMAARPDERFSSAKEMSDSLDQWLRPVPVPSSAEGMRQMPRRTGPVRRSAGVGFNWVLLRNLVVIVVLLVLIRWTWQFTQAQKARVAEDSRPQPAAVVPPEIAEKPAEVAVAPEMITPAVEVPEPQVEPAMDTLERLREALAAGDRSEFPVGTLSRDGAWFFRVDEPMDWYEAAFFAERHGGRLAAEVGLEFEEEPSLRSWLGVFAFPESGWQHLDGTEWNDAAAVAGEGGFLAVETDGSFVAMTGDERLGFVIEWGSVEQTAGLEALLARTAAGLPEPEPEPVFPPGSIERDGDRYLVLPWPVNATEARRLAELAGGHLASMPDAEEAAFLADAVKDRSPETRFWIGAARSAAGWTWMTGEPWNEAQWAHGAPLDDGNDATVLVPRAGWMNMPRSKMAEGLIIEWNAERIPGSPVAEALAGARAARLELEETAKGLVATLEADLQKELADNARTLNWTLDTWLRTMNANESSRWRPHVERLKALVVGNRVPETVGPELGIELSGPMRNIVERCAAKQKGFDYEFRIKARAIHTAYLARLTELPPGENPHPAVIRALEQDREAAADFDRWMAGLTTKVEAAPGGPALRIVKATYGSGGKFADVTERVRDLVLQKKDFWPNPDHLGKDPNPYWRKELTVEYEWNGEPHQRTWGELTQVTIAGFAPGGGD